MGSNDGLLVTNRAVIICLPLVLDIFTFYRLAGEISVGSAPVLSLLEEDLAHACVALERSIGCLHRPNRFYKTREDRTTAWNGTRLGNRLPISDADGIISAKGNSGKCAPPTGLNWMCDTLGNV